MSQTFQESPAVRHGGSKSPANFGSMAEKRCHVCGQSKPTVDFYRDRNRTDGLCGDCKACRKARSRSRPARRRPPIYTVYRLFDQRGELVYVGASQNLPKRLRRHRETASWWPLVARSRIAVYQDRGSALAAEREIIRSEAPRCNKVHRVFHV